MGVEKINPHSYFCHVMFLLITTFVFAFLALLSSLLIFLINRDGGSSATEAVRASATIMLELVRDICLVLTLLGAIASTSLL